MKENFKRTILENNGQITLINLSKKLRISQERVRQIIKAELNKEILRDWWL